MGLLLSGSWDFGEVGPVVFVAAAAHKFAFSILQH
jgi:hypothetical protein